jgi:sulfopyruvate decarboxylase TPP-binding subunit
MRGTHQRQGLASYRDVVTERMKAGVPFGAVEDTIDKIADLTSEQKAALWLFAFSLRAPSEQQRDARAHLAFVQ